MRIALQLYSLRTIISDNSRGTIEAVGSMGYDGVELAGTYGFSASELKDLLAANLLEPMGSHVSIQALRDDIDKEIAYAREAGIPLVICPMMREPDAEAWQEFGRELECYANAFAQAGIAFGYHNHTQEFEPYGENYMLDVILDAAPTLWCELDAHWAVAAGADPLAYCAKRSDRVRLIHAKDISYATGKETLVGEGDLDFAALAAAAPLCEWMVVEQEGHIGDPLDEVRIGLENLKRVFA